MDIEAQRRLDKMALDLEERAKRSASQGSAVGVREWLEAARAACELGQVWAAPPRDRERAMLDRLIDDAVKIRERTGGPA